MSRCTLPVALKYEGVAVLYRWMRTPAGDDLFQIIPR